MTRPPQEVRCGMCRHFFVTYEPTLPWGCRSFGFKSANLPSQEVLAATGTVCARFEARPTVARGPQSVRRSR
ncbi:MAG: hypothetical protein FJX19_00340 [Alphaproteobacteria bacterium]|nr:hypothetical protein [Alphaproteobacteria bacterium]